MMTTHVREIELLSGCFEREIDDTDLAAVVANESWTTAADLVAHVGGIYLWVAATLQSGVRAERNPLVRPEPGHETAWFAAARSAILEQLGSTDPARPCWTLAGDGVSEFWSRRMHIETLMHLGDLRTAGGVTPHPVAESGIDAYADGIDEHLGLFLDRSRSTLNPLSNELTLVADDSDHSWSISPEWTISHAAAATHSPATVVRATTADLALFAWDRLEPLQHPDRFIVDGPPLVVAEYRAAPIHP